MTSIKQKTSPFTLVYQAVVSAFSTYSIITMPQLNYRPEVWRYTLAAFPLVGTVCGLFIGFWSWLCIQLGFSAFFFAAGAFALNALLTGAIHLDGFADASDAIFSRRDRSEMLRIMHDPHIGPMAVIALIAFSILEVALLYEFYALSSSMLSSLQVYIVFMCILTLGRVLSASLVLLMPKARKDGMAANMAKENDKLSPRILGVIFIVFATALVVAFGWPALAAVVSLVLFVFGWSRYFSKTFGGITGDLSGLFLVLAEWFGLLIFTLVFKWLI